MKGKVGQYKVANVRVIVKVETPVGGIKFSPHMYLVQKFAKSKEKETDKWKKHLLHIDKVGQVVFHGHHVLKFYLKLV